MIAHEQQYHKKEKHGMTQWNIDPAHSEIAFKVKHMVISTVTGQFRQFKGTIEVNDSDFNDARMRFEANIDSISTNNEQRDAHLKSPDFFDVANHPQLTFVSKSFARNSSTEFELIGDMTIRGITKEIKLDVVFNGIVKGFDGDIAAFEITGKLNRQDFGLRWNALTEAGGFAVGDEVKLSIVVELKKAGVEELAVAV
ncbi:MAG TPA: YceI family protein [Bacteroidota bacterium]|nr:YceI family protein [Bacteroidota bacterium]